MPTSTKRSDVGQELFDLFHAVRRVTLETFSDQGLSFARAKVLWTLETDGPMRASSLAEHLDCAAATATELVDALVRDGFAERAPDPRDRRAVLIDLTDTGRDLARTTRAQKHRILDQIFDCLDDAQVDQLKTLLGHVAGSPRLQGATA